MLKKVMVGAVLFAVTASGVGATTALAAPNGQVEQGNGRSICRFSGLNDNPNEAFPENGQVQSFGQLVKKLGPQGLAGTPGTECNPNKGADLHAGGSGA